MIAACPKCEARYRIDESRVGEDGVRLRCTKCQSVFRVRAPAAPAAAPAEPRAADKPAAPPPEISQRDSSAPADVDREKLVIVADSDVECGKRTVSALSSWGLQPILVHDGVEAMLTIQRMLPRAVVLDAALPKMYGFQVCEVIKRNDSLRNTGVVLVGAIHNRNRYHRPPADLYGADVYLEQPDLPEGLVPILRGFGLEVIVPGPIGPASSTPSPMPEVAAAPAAPAAVPAAPAAATPDVGGGDDPLADERAKAERLARIVVSDIALYQPERFAEAIRQGNVVEAMDPEIEEGRSLFRQRVDESVRAERDFIVEELLRVARDRGMQ